MLAGGVGDLPADVYAFGTVLWELASWQAPFDGVNPYTVRAPAPPWPGAAAYIGGSADRASSGLTVHRPPCHLPPAPRSPPPQIINTVQGAARGSGLDPPPAAQLPAGPLASYDAYRALMEVRLLWTVRGA